MNAFYGSPRRLHPLWSAALTCASVIAAVGALPPAASAATVVRDVAIANAGFEAQPLDDGDYTDNDVTGWSISGGAATAGAQNPLATWLPTVPEGQNVAFLNTFNSRFGITEGSLYQTLAETVVAGTQYRLTAEIGRRTDVQSLPRFTAELYSGDTILAFGFLTNADVPVGGFSTLTLDYTGTSDVTGPLGIRFRSFYDVTQGNEVRQAAIDSVRLTATSDQVMAAVPEPANWAMMVGGFGLMGGALRHRRRGVAATFV